MLMRLMVGFDSQYRSLSNERDHLFYVSIQFIYYIYYIYSNVFMSRLVTL